MGIHKSGAGFGAVSKRFQMVGFRGSTWKKSSSEIFRFGYGKGSNDKKVPDRVSSGCFQSCLAASPVWASVRITFIDGLA